MKLVTTVSLTSLLILSACTPSQNNNSKMIPLLQDTQNIISTRAQNQTHVMALVKLQTPSLLETSSKEEGVTIVDNEQAAQITSEQTKAIADMKALDTEVQVLYKYRYVLNAVAVLAPIKVLEKLKAIGTIASWEGIGTFARPITFQTDALTAATKTLTERNSSKFIGAEKLNEAGLTGKGIRVGVIDTGIDYTHSMFKGVGTAEAYKAIDPAKEALGFPSEKIRGGVDLVGTEYDSASPDFFHRVPKPDLNPLDEGGHGTHVAGTIAGIGDNVTSYNGMAPDADLYAIKVFGADGSTSDMVVIAGLEYSADPNGDGDLRDQLDIVNLSLGSGYGNPKILYAEAVKNLAKGGTVSVISAGNSGAKDYIVGAPGTSTEALSVAASIDNGDHNWHFTASVVKAGDEEISVETMEAATTQKVSEGDVSGALVHIGNAAAELTEEQKAAVKGHVALIDRGAVTFNDKVKRAAEAGAIGVVVANNQEGAAFTMGTTDKFDIPAIMITKDVGVKLKAALAAGQGASIQFKTDKTIEKPELIDTLTGFSSKGPRSIDGFLKPEISAPGSDIISAAMGKGSEVVKLSGTSMAAPHMAGVLALVKQSFKNREIEVSALDLKHVAMGTSKTIGDLAGRYPVSRQGSGRVQADVAALSDLIAEEPSVSFGEINIEAKKVVKSTLHLKNVGAEDKTVSIEFVGNEFVQLNNAQLVTLKAGESTAVKLTFTLDATKMKDAYVREMDGWVLVKANGAELYRVPVLAVAHKLSAITSKGLSVLSSANDAEGSAVELSLKNESANAGEVLLFNLLAKDERKPLANSFMNADCDLQTVGYRIVSKETDAGVEQFVEFGVKVYKPMTTWNSCDVSILVDSDKDGVVEQEILGANTKSIPGETAEIFASTLIDATKAREIRKAFEAKIEAVKNDAAALQALKDQEKYTEALIDQNDLTVYNNSTVVVMQARISQLKLDSKNQLNFKVVVTHNEQASVQMDDHLSNEKSFSVSMETSDQAFLGLGEAQVVNAGASSTVELTKGRGQQSLLVLLPQNKVSFSDALNDLQALILKPEFKAP
ncbi:MAG: S8 family serine peptidase [Pseudobdellovibrio sp.]|nr:S8 family serine peptidase [Pseudobdellovibrio sp.]